MPTAGDKLLFLYHSAGAGNKAADVWCRMCGIPLVIWRGRAAWTWGSKGEEDGPFAMAMVIRLSKSSPLVSMERTSHFLE
jgi:hypothetical protein